MRNDGTRPSISAASTREVLMVEEDRSRTRSGHLLLIVLFLVFVVCVVWPLLGLKRVADAVEARDAVTFTRLLDVPELKSSIGGQIARPYRKWSGGAPRVSPRALNMPMQAGMAAADGY